MAVPTTAVAGWQRWAREVRLLPARYVGAYVMRNKTNAADDAALLQALRDEDIVPVWVKSVEQQALQALHRSRSAWMATRTARFNTLRGFCREFGITRTGGGRRSAKVVDWVSSKSVACWPIRPAVWPRCCGRRCSWLIEENRLLEARIGQLEKQLAQLARQSPACTAMSLHAHLPRTLKAV